MSLFLKKLEETDRQIIPKMNLGEVDHAPARNLARPLQILSTAKLNV